MFLDWQDWAIIGLAMAGLTAYLVYRWIGLPLRRIESMIHDLAEGRTPRTFLIDGAPWFRRLAFKLETIAHRNQLLSQEHRAGEFNLYAILDGMVEGVMVVDLHHVIRLVNPAFQTLFRLRQTPVGRTVLEAIMEASVETLIHETIVTGKPQSRQITLLFSAPLDQGCFIQVNAVPIHDATGTVSGAVAVFHDITRLRELEEMRKEFVANVSHELRTPLSIFRGYIETLLDNPKMPSKEVQRVLQTMQRHSNRLGALVDDLMMLTQIESNRMPLTMVEIPLKPFLSRVADDFRKKPSAADARMTIEVAPEELSVQADSLRIEQVLFNLLDNAVTYAKSSAAEITIRACMDGADVVITVRDSGIGIPANDLQKIFGRFYRVDKSRERRSGGTGLGLSIVKHIVQLHGGSVKASSELGHWTEIVLRLPQDPKRNKSVNKS